ncbi:GH92 family glycosyl hydrolase [Actinacidiphila yeochonensis]|uniref:GH92 family glycosyl hydrolase n=1 Tax=Actinacidiphila yeochonensis TaxID=89050 RepID=UPI000569B8C4|nr:GH92 family glycosyl hydrolase [Actinacidiphila yeochonensis]
MTVRRRESAPRAGRLRRRLAVLSAAGVTALSLQSFAAAGAAAGPQPVKDPAALVNPLIGTSGAVNTFPGPDVPFGMMQWGPDTTPSRTQGGGYEYKSTKISGFSLTHVSGPGCDVAGDVPILPVSGALSGNLSNTAETFSHSDETTGIGSYTVKGADGVTTELTDTARAGLGKFTFPAGQQSNLLLKLSGGASTVDGTRVKVVGDREVVGAVDSGHFCGANNRYTLHFDIKFNRPFTASGTWVGSTINPGVKSLSKGKAQQTLATPDTAAHQEQHFTVPARTAPTVHPSGTSAGSGAAAGSSGSASASAAPKADGATAGAAAGSAADSAPVTGANGMYLTFDTTSSATVKAAVGISYTSDDNAAANLSTEISGWNLNALSTAARKEWNDLLGRVRIGGGSHDQQVEFYTALYHALLHPNVFSDDNGQYMGMDDQVHQLAKGQQAQYANYSGWDTYRSQTQLMSMVAPQQTGDIVTSMLNGYDQTGLLPKWASNNGESYVMVGDPATSIIADAYAFGVRDFDTAHALEAMVHEATVPNNDRPGEATRDADGYLPLDGTYGCCNFYGPVSTQLEYDSADYALASFAKSLGKTADYRKFATRAQDWLNVFNPQSGYLQARDADGQWAAGFTPGTSNGFVEGTSAQYTPMVPFDVQQLATARGGSAAWSSYLDSLLDNITDPSGTDADLSNEPSLEIPWEYDYVGQPWKTQEAVRQAQTQLYFNAPVGSFGNDDLGAMSSWYVWSSLGMYPETPGTDTLVLGSPAFPVAQITLGNGKTVSVNAPQAAPDAPYVQALDVNGKAYNDSWLSYAQFEKAGTLDYSLNTVPNTSWASSAKAAPPSDTIGTSRVLAAAAGANGDGLVLQPGASDKASLRVTNLGTKAVTADWKATPASGVSLGASAGSLTVPAGGSATADVPVTAGSDEGTYSVDFAITDHTDGSALTSASMRVAVAKPGELWPYESNEGVYADGAKFSGGFDDGGWAYSQNALASAGVTSGGTVTTDGLTYAWPATGSGKPDNLELSGQTIPQPAGTSGNYLGLLGSAANAPTDGSGVPGQLTVAYTDGTTAKATVTFSDWTLNGNSTKPVAGDTTAATTSYRNTGSGGKDTVKAYVFSVKVPLDASKTVASVTLPVTSASGTAHVFAMTVGG